MTKTSNQVKEVKKRWTYTRCNCGHEACNYYFLNFTRSDGRVTLEEARLVCAAPELLEALKALILDATQPTNHTVNWVLRNDPETVKSFRLARAAIAKAEGQAYGAARVAT